MTTFSAIPTRKARGTLFIEYALILAITVGVFAVVQPLFTEWVRSIAATAPAPEATEPAPTATPSQEDENCVAFVFTTPDGEPFGTVQIGALPSGNFQCVQWA